MFKGLMQCSAIPDTRLVLGLMSGTSLDGLDLGLFKISGTGADVTMEQLCFHTTTYPSDLRKAIASAFAGPTEAVCRLNVELGIYYATQSKLFLTQNHRLGQVHLVGMHGQTIHHIHGHSSLQVGDPSYLAQALKVPVVFDFRSADIAAGGAGAPLVPYLDQLFLRQTNQNIALQNLGGIGNLTYLPAHHDQPVIAFDTGPANGILNELSLWHSQGTLDHDHNGTLASFGTINSPLLAQLLKHPYFTDPPPKSTGREDFGQQYVMDILTQHPTITPADLMATFCDLIAQSLVLGYQPFLPNLDQVYISGGGAQNPVLIQQIQKALSPIPVTGLPANLAFDSDSKEAAAFALFAHERLNQQPTNILSVTGAKKAVSMGKIAFPN